MVNNITSRREISKWASLMCKEKKPFVMGPSVKLASGFPTCLNCYVILRKETDAIPCKKCGWPLCRDCKNHGAECEFVSGFLRSKIHIGEFRKPSNIYNTILIIRVLALRDSNRNTYNKLLRLYDRRRDECNFIESYDLLRVTKFFELIIANRPDSNHAIQATIAKIQCILWVIQTILFSSICNL